MQFEGRTDDLGWQVEVLRPSRGDAIVVRLRNPTHDACQTAADVLRQKFPHNPVLVVNSESTVEVFGDYGGRLLRAFEIVREQRDPESETFVDIEADNVVEAMLLQELRRLQAAVLGEAVVHPARS